MGTGRLEAFSDGVIAIIITIMVLELKVPEGESIASLKPLLPVLFSYVLSFVYVGIYWNNHHHMMQAAEHVNGKVLWANMHLLFWLSLVPFVSAWMGENHFTTMPVVCYGIVLLMNGVAYFILLKQLLLLHGNDSVLAKAVGKKRKETASVVIYIIAIGLAFAYSYIGLILYALVAVIWFIPDKRIENKLVQEEVKKD